jgi:proline iminopeptidase
MRIGVNGTELYFDVEGAGLVPNGWRMRERPVLLILHGGPGYDHACYKPFFSPLADTAQLVYVDHRGQGRSGRPPVESCTIEQMADDAAALCRALGLERPAVLGQSFGGFVALQLALRHPDTVGRLVLVDTGATTADLTEALDLLEQRHGGGARVAAAGVLDGNPDPAVRAAFRRLVWPAYAHPDARAL